MSLVTMLTRATAGLINSSLNNSCLMAQQVRTKWVNHWMMRDVKRRKLTAEHAVDRIRLNTVKRNNLLPIELREKAAEELHNFPRDSCFTRIRARCMLTSRPRGTVKRFHVSRIMFRHLADNNKLAGVQRSMW